MFLLSRLGVTVLALLLTRYLQGSHAGCDGIRSIRNYTNGPLEICERNSDDDLEWFIICSEPTPTRIASLLCRETACRRDCNRFNYTISHQPANTLRYEFNCEETDTRPRQCARDIIMCDSILDTLNCECEVDCPNDYTDSGFCDVSDCSCLPGFAGSQCEVISGMGPIASSSLTNSLPFVTMSSYNGQPIHSFTIIPSMTVPTNTTQITQTNQVSGNETVTGPRRIVRIAVGISIGFIIAVCIILLICVFSLVYYIRTRTTKLKALERRIIFTNNPTTIQSLDNELVDRCEDIDHLTYACVNYNDLLENIRCHDEAGEPRESHYSSLGAARRNTGTTQYLTPSINLAEIANVPTHYSNLTETAFTSNHSDTQVGNVENTLYFRFNSDEPVLELTNSDIYSTYNSLSDKPHNFSSTIVLSHRQRIEETQPVCIEQGKMYFCQQNFFVEPPSDVERIYDDMNKNNFREINKDCISLQHYIGTGCFGEVRLAQWRVDRELESIPVAVKLLKENADEKLRLSFLKEAAIMGQFHHPNVLRLLGIVSTAQPVMLVTELMESDLRTILESLANVQFNNDKLAVSLLRSTREIVSGMQYLSSMHFVHRDLAARNVLVGQDRVCRISDFGMSKRIHEDKDYYRVERGGLVPLRWTAPEALFYRRYSEKSDVWSLGMTLFEVWSVGRKPWSGYSDEEVLGMLSSNQMQGPPTGCPHAIYSLMVSTWGDNSDHRPTFKELSETLNKSDEQLLRIPEEVKSIPKASQLGNDPSFTAQLYSELRS